MKTTKKLLALSGWMLLALLLSAPALSRENDKHQLLLFELDGGKLTLLQRDVVARPLPRRRGPERVRPWRFVASDGKGRVVLRRYLADPYLLRAEFHGRRVGDPIQGVTVRRPGPVSFTLRLPATGIARLTLEKLRPGLTLDAAKRAAAWQQVASIDLSEKGQRP